MRTLLALALLACAPAQRVPASDTAETTLLGSTESTNTSTTSTQGTTPTTPTTGLRGQALSPPLDLPTFTVQNHLGEPRASDFLVDRISVVWFYRDASTAG